MNKESVVSRRCFVGMAGMAACVAGVASTGTAIASGTAWDGEYDIVVVGGGLAGQSAACAVALDGNGATCLLLEKSDIELGGGNSVYSGGAVLYATDHQSCVDYLKALRGTFATPSDEIIETYATGLDGIVDYLHELGASDDDLKVNPPYGQSGWPEYPGFVGEESVGSAYVVNPEYAHPVRLTLKFIQEHSDIIDHQVGARVTALVQNEQTHEIEGVVYEQNGIQKTAHARMGVIMCCGGFESNQQMLEDYLSVTGVHPLAGANNTGDGHLMCQRLGAQFWHMNSVAGFWNGAEKLDGSEHAVWYSLTKQYGITVGINGRRYYWDVDYVGRAAELNGKNPSVLTASRHGHANLGGEWHSQILPEVSWLIFDQAHRDLAASPMYGGYYGAMTDGDIVDDGWAVQADTVEELAEAIGVPSDELAKTIAVWNEMVERGEDIQFYRLAEDMAPISEPPFYAIKCTPEFVNTDGGPVRSARAEILDLDGNPIPHLFSAGEFGSIWSNMYQGGGNLAECLIFGRIATRSALGVE